MISNGMAFFCAWCAVLCGMMGVAILSVREHDLWVAMLFAAMVVVFLHYVVEWFLWRVRAIIVASSGMLREKMQPCGKCDAGVKGE